jgi:regulator of nonsense transcripts 3
MAANLNSRTQANGGMLRVTASQTSGNAPRQAVAKPLAPKLKVIVRRLAPGLSEEEFTTFLGDEWRLEQGKVDWFLYKPGKDSKEYVTSSPSSKKVFC